MVSLKKRKSKFTITSEQTITAFLKISNAHLHYLLTLYIKGCRNKNVIKKQQDTKCTVYIFNQYYL